MGDDKATLAEQIAQDPMLTGESRERPIPWLPEWKVWYQPPRSAKEFGVRLLLALVGAALYILLNYVFLWALDWWVNLS